VQYDPIVLRDALTAPRLARPCDVKLHHMSCHPDRRHFVQLVMGAAVSVVSAKLFAQPGNPDKWTEPPGEETVDDAALIDAATKELARAVAPSSVLCDARYMRVHAFPRFRAAIKAHATSAP
jgi:hypothetical protein